MTSARTNLLLPVENQVRELDAKILFASVAAERGFRVIMGSRHLMHHHVAEYEPGVYLAKSMRVLSERMFGILRDLGYAIVSWDEESLVRPPDDVFYRIRLSPKTVSQSELLMTWGRDDAQVFENYPPARGIPLRVTGNPRIDLLRPELRGYFSARVAELRERFGDFVLVSTNFPRNNHFVPKLSEFTKALELDPKDAPDPFLRGNAAHCEIIFRAFLEMIPRLASAMPDRPIVVRPHPSESHEPWLRAAAEHPNVQVVHEGNVVPWLMASRALIHNGCTTGVEAAVLGTPGVAFQPVRSDPYDMHLPNSVSHRAPDIEALVGTVKAMVHGEMGPLPEATLRDILDPHIAALDGPLATERMLDAIEEAGYGREPRVRPGLARYAKARIHLAGRTALKKLNMRRREHRNSANYHDHRFPGVGLDELRERVASMGALLGRFQQVRAEQLADHIFVLER